MLDLCDRKLVGVGAYSAHSARTAYNKCIKHQQVQFYSAYMYQHIHHIYKALHYAGGLRRALRSLRKEDYIKSWKADRGPFFIIAFS